MAAPSKYTEHAKRPLVSIVIPVFNDQEYIARALETATQQSLKNIEIICVDDCSTDGTVQIIEDYVKRDRRVKLIKHKENASAFRARYTGIKAAMADYILFLDGDDELHSDAAKLSYKQATNSDSDIVGFGSRILRQDGSTSREFENSIQPIHSQLTDSDIVAGLFEPNKPAQGSLWRYLFSRKLLLKVYAYFPKRQQLYRTNDLPVSFLSAALAKKYTSIKNRLYIYHFYAGGSGSVNFNLDKFKFYTQAIDSINLLKTIVDKKPFTNEVRDAYYSARLFVISNILRQIKNNLPIKYHPDAINFLLTKVELDEIIYSMASFIPEALDTIRDHLPLKNHTNKSSNIALYTNNLKTGGVQGVVVSQAKYLSDAGFNVTIVLLNSGGIVFQPTNGVKVETVESGPLYVRLKSFKTILQNNKIDTMIDHNILYNLSWPFFNLLAKSLNIKTIAWIHSFSLRSILEMSSTGEFLSKNIGLIDDLVVLSKADVSYWKSLGHKSVYYLPNPPSPLLLKNTENIQPKTAPAKHLNIIWFGRLQQATKRVYSLIDIAFELRKLTDDFTLTIIGPHSDDLKIWQVKQQVELKNLDEYVKVVGPKHGTELIDELKKADLFVSTSIIEGYPLTFTEAQSYAIPVVMYELPWLAVVENNDGIIQTPQQNPALAAQEIYKLFTHKELYERSSKASLRAAKSYLTYDFASLYTQLLNRQLPKKFSPDISVEHMGLFMKWTQLYSYQRNLLYTYDIDMMKNVVRRKDTEIASLKNSRAMKTGNAIAKPVRAAKLLKQNLAKYRHNR